MAAACSWQRPRSSCLLSMLRGLPEKNTPAINSQVCGMDLEVKKMPLGLSESVNVSGTVPGLRH
jgi:hypothetical protein